MVDTLRSPPLCRWAFSACNSSLSRNFTLISTPYLLKSCMVEHIQTGQSHLHGSARNPSKADRFHALLVKLGRGTGTFKYDTVDTSMHNLYIYYDCLIKSVYAKWQFPKALNTILTHIYTHKTTAKICVGYFN